MSTPKAGGPIAGVVLAAGRSRRMGEPKPLLELDGRTFIERTIRALADGGCDPVACVVPEQQPALADAARGAGALVVPNRDPDSEQVASLRLALDALGDVAAAIVLPADHPLVEVETVRRLIDAFRAHGRPIVRASHDGTPGHPTLFAREVFAELRPGLPEGARSVIARHGPEVEDVRVRDEGVEADIDTPSELRRWTGR